MYSWNAFLRTVPLRGARWALRSPGKAHTFPFPLEFGHSAVMKLYEGWLKQEANERLDCNSCFPVSSSHSYVLLLNNHNFFFFVTLWQTPLCLS